MGEEFGKLKYDRFSFNHFKNRLEIKYLIGYF